MGGKRIEVNQAQLIATINELENKNTYTNLLALQNAVVNSSYGQHIGITAPNVYNYIKKWNIEVKTKRGKVGTNLTPNTTDARVSRSDKMKSNPKTKELTNEVRISMKGLCSDINPKTPGTYKFNSKQFGRLDRLCNKLEKGSLKAAIHLTCVSCCAGDFNEIRLCEIVDCPLFQFRPYKLKKD